MKNFPAAALIFLALPLFNLKAQQITKTDTISGTPVTMTMARNISDVMARMEDNCSRKSEVTSDYNPDAYRPSTPKAAIKVVPNRALTNAEVCRQNPRILGYKIQLTVVKSNDEANKVKAYFRNRFPSLKAETDASLRPNYKVLAGSYFSKQSAAGDLARIRQYFKSAIPVEYRVFCVEAK